MHDAKKESWESSQDREKGMGEQKGEKLLPEEQSQEEKLFFGQPIVPQ